MAVAERLPTGVLITNEGDGHGAVTARQRAASTPSFAAYLIDGTSREDGTTCDST